MWSCSDLMSDMPDSRAQSAEKPVNTKKGYKYYDWNVDSDDAGHAKNKEQVYNNVTSGLKKDRANVVLMHDFEKNNKTLDALKDIIKYGKENGYSFNKISSSSDLVVHHHVQN